MSSRSIININWNKLGSRYDALFGSKTAEGKVATPTVGGITRWLTDFLTANFQRELSSVMVLRRAKCREDKDEKLIYSMVVSVAGNRTSQLHGWICPRNQVGLSVGHFERQVSSARAGPQL